MISVYKNGDEFVWVPVAKENANNSARAFLPFMGLDGEYLYGYKARIERGRYYEALSDIQNSAISNTSEVFSVNGGTKTERQYKAKWRHGRKQDSPLLGATKGWVKVPSIRITEYTETELAQALDRSDSDYAVLSTEQTVIEPVLCDDASDLARQSTLLRKTILNKVAVGQFRPKKIVGTREVFVRDATVVAYVLNEANGICECCGLPGPFKRDDGEQYLEIHHVKHLAAGGSDTTRNAIAACPNCHRELHFGAKKAELIEKLFANVDRLVRE